MIVKTRQPAAKAEEVFDPALGRSRGVLRRDALSGKFSVSRRSPAPELAHCIAHYWTVSWDLRGHAPHVQETLPHPNIYLVFEDAKLLIGGVSTSKFTRVLSGQSFAFGVKFTPGGFYPFLKSPAHTLTDRILPVDRIFGKDGVALEAALAASRDEEERVQTTERFFRLRAPGPDETVALAGRLVERILRETEIKTVDDLVRCTGIGKRTLQRTFNQYVGINPKWVIRRYRLHELIERIDSGERLNWPDLALELGYFDQAHLIHDFQAIVGHSPARYRERAGKEH